MTYSEFIDEIIANAFPEGYAENLAAIYEKRILSGLIELQRWVPYLSQRQTQLYHFNSTSYRQGTTVICRPEGRVKRLATFASKTLKDIVYYDPCTREDIDRLTAQRARSVTYPNAVPTEFGLFSATDDLDKNWRSERGLFCVDDDQIILLPHIESIERVMVEFTGSKTDYDDDDIIDYGKYQRQVTEALENYLLWKSMGKDDRSTQDYLLAEKEWNSSVAGLQLDTKSDTEAELPLDDVGILPRAWMPVAPISSALACNYDPTNAFFYSLWVMADNDKYYNLGALLLDGSVVEYVTGDGELGGKPEVTYETIRAAQLNLRAGTEADDDFYKLVPRLVDGEPVHGFEGDAVDDSQASPCSGVACINVDVLSPDDQLYYRLNLLIVDGVPVVQASAAPAASESPVSVPVTCAYNEIILRDQVTQKCIHVRVENGNFSISDS